MSALVFFDHIGKQFFTILNQVKEGFFFCYLSFRNAFLLNLKKNDLSRLKSTFDIFLSQIYFTGVMALPLIFFVALATGSIAVMGATEKLSQLGQAGIVGKVLVMVVIREVSPLFTALIVIARSGTAVASELGSMQVNKEIESLKVMGIDHYSYVVFPRIFAGVISLVGLVFYFNIVALIGGFLVAGQSAHLPFTIYINSITEHMTLFDLSLIMLKNIFAGFIIFTICSYMGLSVKKSPHEVPQVTTKAVVYSIAGVMFTNLAMTIIYYSV